MALGLGNTYDVSVKFLADLKGYTRGIEKASKKMEEFGKRVQKVGTSLTKNLTLPIIALGTATVNASLKINTAMANVATLIPGATERVIELKEEIQDLAMETGKATGEMVAGLYEVISAFGDTEETMARLEANTRLAVAGFSSVAEAINFTSAATKGFGDISAKAIKNASDLGLLTVRLGKTAFPELASSIGKLTGSAKALNISLEELMAVYATLTGVTGDTMKVTTQIDAAMRAFMKPTEGMTEAIGKLEDGMYSGAEALIGAKGLVGALRAVLETTDGAVESVGKLVESTEAFPLIFALAGAQAEVFDDKLVQMNDSLGTTDEAFKAATEGVNKSGFAWDKFKVKLQVTAERLGDTLAPAFEKIVIWVEKVLDKVGGLVTWFSELDKGTQSFILTIVGLVAAIGPLLIIVGTLTRALVGLRAVLIGTAAAGAAGGVAGGIVGAFGVLLGILSGPVGVIAVIGAAAVVIGVKYYNAVQYANDITASFADTTENMAIRVATAWSEAFESVSDAIYKMDIAIRGQLGAAESALALLSGGRGGFVPPPSKWEVVRPPTEEEIQKGVEGIYNLINVLAASGKLDLEIAEKYRKALKASGEDAARIILDSLRREFHDITLEDLYEAPPAPPGAPRVPGIGTSGTSADPIVVTYDEKIQREFDKQHAETERLFLAARSMPTFEQWFKIQPIMDILTAILMVGKEMASKMEEALPWPFGMGGKRPIHRVGEEPALGGLTGMEFLFGPEAEVERNVKKAADTIKDMFDSISDTILDAVELLGKSIVSGDIASVLTNVFNMLGNAISAGISAMIKSSIGGGGLFGSIVGAFGGGLVGGLIGLAGGLFGGGGDRGATEQTPIFAFITNWGDYFKFGATLPTSFVYSGRAGRYDVDPHGRTLSGWATGQHFDA